MAVLDSDAVLSTSARWLAAAPALLPTRIAWPHCSCEFPWESEGRSLTEVIFTVSILAIMQRHGLLARAFLSTWPTSGKRSSDSMEYRVAYALC